MGKPKKKLSAYNLHMRRELKGKMKGKTKAQRLAIFKAAARAWKSKKKGNPKPRSKPKSGGSSRSSSSTTGGRRVGKSTFNTNKIFGLVRKVALIAPAVAVAFGPGTNYSKADKVIADYTGYSISKRNFIWERLIRGWGAYAGASGATYLIPKAISFLKGLL